MSKILALREFFRGKPRSVCAQKGFSLFEVLLAMFIAAVAVGGVMSMHARNLRQVADNVVLTRAQDVLNNASARVSVGVNSVAAMNADAGAASLNSAVNADVVLVQSGHEGRLLSIRWASHNADATVWRCSMSGAVVAGSGQSCLLIWVLP